MLFKNLIAPLALATLAVAVPIEERQQYSGQNIDGVILNYALTLEHLEASFYKLGLQMYNAGAFQGAGFPDWVRYRFSEIASQEATHVATLTAGLQAAGITPVAACTYDFGITSPQSYLALAQILEGVGVSAYLGAAPLVTSKTYLAIAGSILVVEARHETWLRAAAANQDPSPRSFAVPLNFNQVYTLAAPFIKSCPASNPTLPVKAFPGIKVNTAGPFKTGQSISITIPTSLSGTLYAAFVDALATTYQQITPQNGQATVTIPSYATGEGSYLIITNAKSVSDSSTVAGPAIVPVPVPATLFSY